MAVEKSACGPHRGHQAGATHGVNSGTSSRISGLLVLGHFTEEPRCKSQLRFFQQLGNEIHLQTKIQLGHLKIQLGKLHHTPMSVQLASNLTSKHRFANQIRVNFWRYTRICRQKLRTYLEPPAKQRWVAQHKALKTYY